MNLFCLNHGKEIAGRVFKPRDIWLFVVFGSAKDAFLVGFHLAFERLELNAKSGQFIDSLVDVANRKIKDRECRRLMIRFRIYEYFYTVVELQAESFPCFGDINPSVCS